MTSLLFSIRFHDGRYHGVPDWPPSPARFFQALVASASRGEVGDVEQAALRWLETLDPPRIRTPRARQGQAHVTFVPNNDLDAKGGDPAEISSIRAGKTIRPWLFDAATPLLYRWRFDPSPDAISHAHVICLIAASLCQLGRGIDMAWATGDVLDDADADSRIDAHSGTLHTPSRFGSGGAALACPGPGTLDSLVMRHAASSRRFRPIIEAAPTKADPERMKVSGQSFAHPPKARLRQVRYDCPPTRLLYDLSGARAPWPLDRAVDLVEAVRDEAVRKLTNAFAGQDAGRVAEIERVLIGRGAQQADKALRVRIIPLPSIGHPHVTRAIRRVLVEVPPDCPLKWETLDWALAGLGMDQADPHPETGEIADIWRLSPAEDWGMLRHYGVEPSKGSTRWQSVTPLALSSAPRRRIEPSRIRQPSEQKTGQERVIENSNAAHVVAQALRHAGVTANLASVTVQREPFAARGARAEAFAKPGRFPKEQLWHVELELDEPVSGPLIVGDGRYLGLGLMHPTPVASTDIVHIGVVGGQTDDLEPEKLCRAFRRAVLSRLAATHGEGAARRPFISGHEEDGAPLRRGDHQHVAFAFDPHARIFLVIHPDLLSRKSTRRGAPDSLDQAATATAGEWTLWIDRKRTLSLRSGTGPKSTGLLTRATEWTSVTPYLLTRHVRRGDLHAAAAVDIVEECRRNSFPLPEVDVFDCRSSQGRGVFARARLRFASEISGPVILGRNRHTGGGLFAATTSKWPL